MSARAGLDVKLLQPRSEPTVLGCRADRQRGEADYAIGFEGDYESSALRTEKQENDELRDLDVGRTHVGLAELRDQQPNQRLAVFGQRASDHETHKSQVG